MNGFEAFEGAAAFNLHANNFDPDFIKKTLGQKPIGEKKLKEQFLRVLKERPYTFETWEDLTYASYDTDEELYEDLQKIYNYLFLDGPL